MKLLQAIALGIPIVTDSWLKESAKRGKFLNPRKFSPKVPDQEAEWGFSLAVVWSQPQTDLFQSKTIYFTQALQKIPSFKEMQEVCKIVGAKKVLTNSKGIKDKNTIIMALEEGDEEAVALAKEGHPCYSKDLLTLSILRGEVDLENDELKLNPTTSQPKAGKKGRPRRN